MPSCTFCFDAYLVDVYQVLCNGMFEEIKYPTSDTEYDYTVSLRRNISFKQPLVRGYTRRGISINGAVHFGSTAASKLYHVNIMAGRCSVFSFSSFSSLKGFIKKNVILFARHDSLTSKFHCVHLTNV